MLTLYQLKQNGCFRAVYKAPYYVKNVFLLVVQSVILFIIYIMYFRADGGTFENGIKILRGLNSNTFNYLEQQKSLLKADTEPLLFSETTTAVNSINFFSQCVRLNKPCVFK